MNTFSWATAQAAHGGGLCFTRCGSPPPRCGLQAPSFWASSPVVYFFFTGRAAFLPVVSFFSCTHVFLVPRSPSQLCWFCCCFLSWALRTDCLRFSSFTCFCRSFLLPLFEKYAMKFLLVFFTYPAYANSLLVFLLPVELLCSPCVPLVFLEILCWKPREKKAVLTPGHLLA